MKDELSDIYHDPLAYSQKFRISHFNIMFSMGISSLILRTIIRYHNVPKLVHVFQYCVHAMVHFMT